MANVKDKIENAAEKVEDALIATEIETKKTARTATRKAKAKVEKAVGETKAKAKKASAETKETADAVAAVAADQATGAAIGTKRKARSTARKAKETVEAAVSELKEKTAAPNIVIQSPMGGNITPEEIVAKLPKDVESVFVCVDQNKLWWVKKDGETGFEDIW